jgi:hypothetical protein
VGPGVGAAVSVPGSAGVTTAGGGVTYPILDRMMRCLVLSRALGLAMLSRRGFTMAPAMRAA